MKKLLKFMLMPILVGTPAMSVVACGDSDSQLSPDQILNIAAGRISTGMFKMLGATTDTNKLNLEKLPRNGTAYNDLDDATKQLITTYFQNIVKAGSSSSAGLWPYQTVNATVTDAGTTFTTDNVVGKVAGTVQAKIKVNVNLSYSGLQRTKAVDIIIINDKTTNQQKVDVIRDDLMKKLNDSPPVVTLATLPKDGILGNDKAITWTLSTIGTDLRAAWVSGDHKLLDYAGNIGITISPTADTTVVYKLNDSNAFDPATGTVSGTLQNLNITIHYSGYFDKDVASAAAIKTDDLAGKAIKVQQDESGLFNQIQTALSPTTPNAITIQLKKTPMPNTAETWDHYVKNNPSVQAAVKNIILRGAFDATSVATGGIFSVYPYAKMTTVAWDETNYFGIKNEVAFNPQGGANMGYFRVNFEFKIANPSNPNEPYIDVKTNSIQININGN